MYDNLGIDNRIYLIYSDIGNYHHWVKESLNAEKFFDNYDKLCKALEELTQIEYEYHEPAPEIELKELKDNEQIYIRSFLSRYWRKTISEADKLKTEKGKANKIKSFFDSLEPYKERFSEETFQMLDNAKNEQSDYTLKQNTKTEKDNLFMNSVEKSLDKQNVIMNGIETSTGNFAWFYQNNYLLSKIMREEIDFDIVYDITRLMLAGFDHKKASRFLRIKYGINTKSATQLYITACGIVSSHMSILRYQNSHYKQYIIITHNCPCPICQKLNNKIFNISDAEIGVNYPPLCKYNCSTTGIYIEGITKINK